MVEPSARACSLSPSEATESNRLAACQSKNRQQIFECSDDYNRFLEILKEQTLAHKDYGRTIPPRCTIYSYCLMGQPTPARPLVAFTKGGARLKEYRVQSSSLELPRCETCRRPFDRREKTSEGGRERQRVP